MLTGVVLPNFSWFIQRKMYITGLKVRGKKELIVGKHLGD